MAANPGIGSSIAPREQVVVVHREAIQDQRATKTTITDIKDRKFSWGKLRRIDSLDLEAGRISGHHGGHGSKVNSY